MNPSPVIRLERPVLRHRLTHLLDERNQTLLHGLIFLFGFLFFGAVSVWLGQDNNWDLRNYHFYNPYAYIEGRLELDYAPAQLQTFLTPTGDLLFYFFVTHLKPIWVGFFMGGIHGLNFGLVFAIAHQLLAGLTVKTRVGLSVLVSAVGLYGPVFIAELGASQNDVLTSLFVLASIFILIRRLSRSRTLALPEGRNALILAGVLIGLGAGLKLTVLIYVIGATLALLFTKGNWEYRIGIVTVWGVAVVIGFIIAGGHWMATLWSAYGNPLFPFYNAVFKSPYYELVNFGDHRYLPQSLMQGLVYPFHFLIQTQFTYLSNNFRDSRYAVIYVLAILYLINLYIRWTTAPARSKKARKKENQISASEQLLLVFFLASYLIWALKFSVIRYVVPLELLAPLGIYILVRQIFQKVPAQAVMLGVAFLMVIVIVKPPEFQRLPWSATFFEVEPPQFEDPDNTIVIIAGGRPWAYLIPFFQSGVRFVRIGGNFTHPSRPNRMQTDMRALMQGHQGPIYLLSRREYLSKDASTLSYYQLFLTTLECKLIKSKHEKAGLCLWTVVRRSG